MSQYISLQQAIAMTTLYREQKVNILADPYKDKDILALCETFDREVCDTLLAKPGCAKIRIYYGMDESLKIHAILVPVNEKGEDILPDSAQAKSADGRDIGEFATRCPPFCSAGSPLNP